MAKEAVSEKVVRSLERAPRLRNADVYLFQEVRQEPGKPSVAAEAVQKLGYFTAFNAAPGFVDQGLAIASRYPLTDVAITPLKNYDLRFHTRNRFAMSATMNTPWGAVRVWNVHLDTRINSGDRLAQLQPVFDDAGRHSGPKLVGGDFNTNEFYWVGNVLPIPFVRDQGPAVRNSMKQLGFETPLQKGVKTHPLLRSHLDWIFLSELKALSASVEPASFSDHNAVWVRAKL